MLKIAVLFGGRSGEHEVSCVSAAAVLNHLSKKYEAILIGITRDGIWFLQDLPKQPSQQLRVNVDPLRLVHVVPGEGLVLSGGERIPVDAVLPILHGSFGEDGTVQGLLETARLAYAGSSVSGSAVGMDKDLSKRLFREAGLPVTPGITLYSHLAEDILRAQWKSLVQQFGTPLFVKPSTTGSSLGVKPVETEEMFLTALETAWKYSHKALVEKAISGREIECAVMGYREPEAFPPGEIIPVGAHTFYDYDAKYTDPDGAILKIPADLAEPEKIMKLAVQAYSTIGAGGLARVDFFLEEITNKVYINEINTLPGMTSISLFPQMVMSTGMSFTAILDNLITGALQEHSFRENLVYSL